MWGYLAFILRPLNSSGYMGMELSTPLGDTCSKICELVPLGVVGRRLCGISSCYSNCSEVSSISSSVSLSHLICWDCLSDSLLWLPSLCAGRQLCWLRLASGVTINIVVGKKNNKWNIPVCHEQRKSSHTSEELCSVSWNPVNFYWLSFSFYWKMKELGLDMQVRSNMGLDQKCQH